MDEMYPNFTLGVVGFSPGFYRQRPAAKALVRAYIRATRDYDNAVTGRSGEAERTAVDAIFASHTGLSPATVRDVVPVGLNPNGLPNRESVTACYSFFREQGLIPEPLSDAQLASVWGTDLVDEVLDEIGRVPES